MRGDLFSAIVSAVLLEAIVLLATVAEDLITRKVRTVEDVLHQSVFVDKVQLAVSERAGPVGAVFGELTVKYEEIKCNDGKDSSLGAAVNFGGDPVD